MALKQQTQLDMSINGNLIRDAVKSFNLSKRYVHRIVKASVFNIMYRRLPINENELRLTDHKKVPIVLLKSNSLDEVKDPYLNLYISWLKGIKDAINKSYLKALYIYMKDADGNLLESYSFHLKYNPDPNYTVKDSSNVKKSEELNEATRAILQAIAELGEFEKLSLETVLEIELTYTEDCPPNYQPPSFVAVEKPQFLNVINPIRLAEIGTGYHKITARSSQLNFPRSKRRSASQAPLRKRSPSDMDLEPSVNDAHIILDDLFNSAYSAIVSVGGITQKTIADEGKKVKKTTKSPKKKVRFNNSDITISEHNETIAPESDTENDSSVVQTGIYVNNCICQLNFQTKVHVIRCLICSKLYHGPCCGYLLENDKAMCPFCGEDLLSSYGKKKQPIIAQIRLILNFIIKNVDIPAEILTYVKPDQEKQLVIAMKELGICEESASTLDTCTYHEEKIKEVAVMFFKDLTENPDDSDYLL